MYCKILQCYPALLPWQVHHKLLGIQAKIHKINMPGAVARSDPRPPGLQTVTGSILRLFSLFQNLELGIASTNDNCHFAISSAGSYQNQFLCKRLSNYSKPFMSYGLFSLFQNLQLVIASTDDKCHLAISSARFCQYQLQLRLSFLGSCNLNFSFTVTEFFKIWSSA